MELWSSVVNVNRVYCFHLLSLDIYQHSRGLSIFTPFILNLIFGGIILIYF